MKSLNYKHNFAPMLVAISYMKNAFFQISQLLYNF